MKAQKLPKVVRDRVLAGFVERALEAETKLETARLELEHLRPEFARLKAAAKNDQIAWMTCLARMWLEAGAGAAEIAEDLTRWEDPAKDNKLFSKEQVLEIIERASRAYYSLTSGRKLESRKATT